MNIGLAQINSTVGAIEKNAELILHAYQDLVAKGADLVVTPELVLTGYPPQDLLFVENFVERSLAALKGIQRAVGKVPLVVGCIDCNKRTHGKLFHNAAAFLCEGENIGFVHKRLLPTYDVFDEARYFEAGEKTELFSFRNQKIGITICEDIWTPPFLPQQLYAVDPPAELVAEGATLLLNLSASPFQIGKPRARAVMLQAQAQRFRVPLVYCNAVGGNDQLIFDGHSLVIDACGHLLANGAGFREENRIVKMTEECHSVKPTTIQPSANCIEGQELQELYEALVLGIRDYLKKCGFQRVLIGLSGGIDSALVATLAVAALGADAVTGVLMPGPYSSQGSIDDALLLAQNLKIQSHTFPITPVYHELERMMAPVFARYQQDATEENMQARLRGITLMALSNKFNSLVLTTGNKSELAVGYCTLYGDMCGGLAVISDLPKTLVYRLAEWINRDQEIIPRSTIKKAPSAELRPDQRDQDTLPPYEILDAILELAVEKNCSLETIVAQGFERTVVEAVLKLVRCNEYKRQQAAPGLKVTCKAFSRGRCFPIAQGYRE